MKICIVIPAHNEEKRIVNSLHDFKETILKKYGKNLTLVIVSDGSTDKTNDIVKKWQKKYSQIKLIIGEKREGKGSALIRGFHIACDIYNPDIVGFVDADPSVSGIEIIKLLTFLQKKGVDGVIASRYLKDSKIIGELGKARFIASRSYNVMIRVLFGLGFKDTQCGAKFFKAKSLCKVLHQIHLTDMSFDINLLYELHRRRFNVKEVPITYNVVKEHSKVTVSKQIPKMFVVTVSYRITRSPLNRIIPNKLKGAVYNKVRKW